MSNWQLSGSYRAPVPSWFRVYCRVFECNLSILGFGFWIRATSLCRFWIADCGLETEQSCSVHGLLLPSAGFHRLTASPQSRLRRRSSKSRMSKSIQETNSPERNFRSYTVSFISIAPDGQVKILAGGVLTVSVVRFS